MRAHLYKTVSGWQYQLVAGNEADTGRAKPGVLMVLDQANGGPR